MSGFSIELLTDGCKAIDPASRNRYEVKRTGNDTPLTEGGEAPAARKSRVPRAAKAPRPEVSIPAPGKLPEIAVPEDRDSRTEVRAANAELVARTKPETKSEPKPEDRDSRTEVRAADAELVARTKPETKSEPKNEPKNEPKAETQKELPAGARVLMKREQEPTAAAPLTYREYAFEVSRGSSETAAVAVLLAELERIQARLASAPAGKLVNLAAFDEAFEGRPKVLPLATVTWKDWRTDVSKAFPRRDRPEPGPRSGMREARSEQAAPAVQPAPAQGQPAAPARSVPPAAKSAPEKAASVAPPAAAAKSVAPRPAGTKSIAPAAPRPSASPPKAAPSESKLPRRSKAPPPAQKTPKRVAGEELIAVLFESMHDMHFMSDAVEGASFCLELAALHLPARVAIVYLYDINRREFVVASARGAEADALLLKRYSESETLLTKTMRKQRGLLLSEGDVALSESPMFQAFGAAKSAILAPVKLSGRFLGIVLVADSTDGVAFTEMDASGVNYMAEQLAEFLGARGVVIDPDRIKPGASA